MQPTHDQRRPWEPYEENRPTLHLPIPPLPVAPKEEPEAQTPERGVFIIDM